MGWFAVLQAALDSAPEAIAAVAAIAGTIYGVWNKMKARDWQKSSDHYSALLADMVVAVEMLPHGEQTTQIKLAVDRIQRYSGQYSEAWVAMVTEIEGLVRTAGLNDKADDMLALSRAADAVAQARAARKGIAANRAIVGSLPTLLLVAGLCVCFSGCLTGEQGAAPERLTRETVWPAEPGVYPAEIVIEWPYGVRECDVRTVTIDARVLTTAPKPEAAVTSGTEPTSRTEGAL